MTRNFKRALSGFLMGLILTSQPFLIGVNQSVVFAQTQPDEMKEFFKQDAKQLKKIEAKRQEIEDEITRVIRAVIEVYLARDVTSTDKTNQDILKQVRLSAQDPNGLTRSSTFFSGPIIALRQLAMGKSNGFPTVAYGFDRNNGELYFKPESLLDNVFESLLLNIILSGKELEGAIREEAEAGYLPAFLEDDLAKLENTIRGIDRVSAKTSDFRDAGWPTFLDVAYSSLKGEEGLKEKIEKLVNELKQLIAEKKRMLADFKAEVDSKDKKTGFIGTDRYQRYALIISKHQSALQILARELGMTIVIKTRAGEVLARFSGAAAQATRSSGSGGGVLGNLFARPAIQSAAQPARPASLGALMRQTVPTYAPVQPTQSMQYQQQFVPGGFIRTQ